MKDIFYSSALAFCNNVSSTLNLQLLVSFGEILFNCGHIAFVAQHQIICPHLHIAIELVTTLLYLLYNTTSLH